MKHKRLTAVVAGLSLCAMVAAVALISACGGPQGTIKIGALLAVTGPASTLGIPEEKTVKMFIEAINKEGVLGKKLEVVYLDTQSKNENAVSGAKQLVEQYKVLAIIGPTQSGESMAIKDYCEKTKTILFSLAASDAIVDPVASYVFKTPQKNSFAAQLIFEDMKANGIKRIAILNSNSGFGMGGKIELEKYAPQYGLEIGLKEEYSKDANDLTDVATKIKAANVDGIVNWSIEPAQSIIIKNIRQLGMKQPIYQSHGFGNIKFAEAAGAAAEDVIFPCGRLFAIDVLPDATPQKNVLIKYKSAYENKYKEEVSSFGGHAYDALLILVEALKIAGSTEPEKVRDAVEKVKNLPGTGGIFTFSAKDHNGLSLDAFEMLTVKSGKFVLYKK